jgi:hypothetical protein
LPSTAGQLRVIVLRIPIARQGDHRPVSRG